VTSSKATAVERLDGEQLLKALIEATKLLSQRADTINALNVFPVPDGDTGTNMLLTMRATVEVGLAGKLTVDMVAATVARAALMGARGNSGVILSQYLKGLARGLAGSTDVDAVTLANALATAAVVARDATDRPVEGTMLTVACDAARAAMACAALGGSCQEVLVAASHEARVSAEHTPDLLPLLHDAGVVDSGALGLATILEGMAASVAGQPPGEEWVGSVATSAAGRMAAASFGFCTEFVMQGDRLDLAEIRNWLHSVGDSVLAVADGDLVRVHVHTLDPDAVIAEAKQRAMVDRVKVENMTEQHDRLRTSLMAEKQMDRCGLVVVAVGDGFAALFQSLGANALVTGGQTFNPSVQELVRAVAEVGARECVLLPNNTNVLAAAQQAQRLLGCHLEIVPTRDLAEGVAAALAFRPDRSAEENARRLATAVNAVRTAQITRAVRSAQLNGHNLTEGCLLGMVGERLVSSGDDLLTVLINTLRELQADAAEVITLYPGEAVTAAEAQVLAEQLQRSFPSQQIECVAGGQPHYLFLVACE